jgi:hypothetical protein
MKYPPTGENATELTAPMLEALHGCLASHPVPFNIRRPSTAFALLTRGFVVLVGQSIKGYADGVYTITERGRIAYHITKKLAIGE